MSLTFSVLCYNKAIKIYLVISNSIILRENKMEILKEINITKDKKLAIWLNIISLPTFFLFSYLFYLLGLKIQHPTIENVTYTIHLGKLFLFVLAILAVVIIHELIHAFFFKLFKPKSKVKFGINWKLGAAYATCPKVTYDRRQMIVISLAPFIIWSLTLTILFGMNLLSFPAYVGIASLHATGCIGDFYYAYLLGIKYARKKILAEDTAVGLIIYSKN